jgi:hypothetical protein
MYVRPGWAGHCREPAVVVLLGWVERLNDEAGAVIAVIVVIIAIVAWHGIQYRQKSRHHVLRSL